MQLLDRVAAQAGAEGALQRLRRLCFGEPTDKFVVDILDRLASEPGIAALTDWAAESAQASSLERLARAAWSHGGALADLAPAQRISRIERRYKRSDLRRQFPAALAGAPRLVKAGPLAAWLDRLACYLLVRSLDALEDGVSRDENIYIASLSAREAVQSFEHTRHAWMLPLFGNATGLIEFEAETIVRCRQARRLAAQARRQAAPLTAEEEFLTDDSSPVRFYDALIAVLEHRPWRPMAVGAALPDGLGPLSPQAAATPWTDDQITSWLRKPAERPVCFGNPDGDGTTIAAQPTSRHHSQKRKERLGTKVRVEHLVETLCLPLQWTHLSPAEETALESRAAALLGTGSLVDRLGAALTLVARVASSSMHDVEAIPLRLEKHHAWSLDIAAGQLTRLAPRFPRRWSSKALSPEERCWLQPVLSEWRYQLSGPVLDTLREAAVSAPGANTVGELWARFSPGQYLERWFSRRFLDLPDLERLGAPATAGSMALEAFRRSGDTVLAGLVSSDHRTALPASSVYGAFSAAEVHGALGRFARVPCETLVAPAEDLAANAAGSELDIVEARVSEAIAGLVDRVRASASGVDWVEHHNLLAALVIVALLASSGARPTNSPFQSLAWFDFKRRLMFVEDKVSGSGRGARLCLLSDMASQLLQQIYIPHLRHLADGLRTEAPEFADEIDRVLRADPEARLPLFFFLRAEPTLDWTEVTETQLQVMSGIQWPLPWNVFRHWMSTGLRRGGVHADVRDALMGHAERGAEPHGDFSPRIPARDFDSARATVDAMQSRIGLRPLEVSRSPVVANVRRAGSSYFDGRPSFGRQARQERRVAAQVAAQDLARREIEDYLGERSIDQLTEEQVDELARKMLFRGTLPHVFASLRYEVLETHIQRHWADRGKPTRLARRYVIARDGQTLFNEHALTAEVEVAAARRAFEDWTNARTRAVDGPVLAAMLASVDMVLYSRLAHLPALTALLVNDRRRYRLVRFQGRCWYEWAPVGEWHDGKPAMRVEISERAFSWIGVLLDSERVLTSTPSVPRAMQDWASAIAPGASNCGRVLRHLIQRVDQVNAFELPGYQVAHLAGRRLMSAMPHADWFRLVSGSALHAPSSAKESRPVESNADPGEIAQRFFLDHRRTSTVTAAQSLQACSKLIEDITAVLAAPEPAKQAPKPKSQPTPDDQANASPSSSPGESSPSVPTSSQKAYAIARLVDGSGFGHGDGPWVLAAFIVNLLTRKPRKGAADRLRTSTVLRYWYSLAKPFRDAVADRNFVGADEEDLTEWYSAIVDAAVPEHEAVRNADPDEAAEDAPASDAPLRTLNQLLDFHDFFREKFGGTDPEWAEVAPDLTVSVGRPGAVRLAEYRAALRSLVGGAGVAGASRGDVQAAFVMLMCFRYGLRISEAIGLSRGDLIDTAGTMTVLVRSNRIRPLKTPAARRVVPQLEKLDTLEQQVLGRVLDDWIRYDGVDSRSPVLVGLSKANYKTTKARIGAKLLELLKGTTRNPLSTVHHLRHAFAMRTMARALEVQIDCEEPIVAEEALALRRQILGRDEVDRRLLWAVARLLGHSSPASTLRSYLHGLDVLARPAPRFSAQEVQQLTTRPGAVVDLDALAREPSYLAETAVGRNAFEAAPATASTPGDLLLRSLHFLRLIVIGRPEQECADKAGLLGTEAKTLSAALARVGDRIKAPGSRFAGFKLLGAIAPARIATLIEHVSKLDSVKLNQGRRISDWLYTFGASRHVLLYEQHHFDAAADFLSALRLRDSSVVVHAVDAHRDLMAFAERACLGSVLRDVQNVPISAKTSRVAKAFQLDVARFGPRDTVEPHRMALVPRPGGLIKDTHEMTVLWLLWNLGGMLSVPSRP